MTPFHLVAKLDAAPELVSENNISMVLFDGVPVKKFDFVPVFLLAGEYFTHLGLTCMLIAHFTVEA